MKETFDQETLHLIIPSKISRMVELISQKTGEDAIELTKKFYGSKTYEELSDESSKYWWFSPAELGEIFQRERALTI